LLRRFELHTHVQGGA